ncbi:ATP-dependent RecD-like DNA helicase [bacterium]|nr:ATP-dependent RecD-like DNA helicase [bacterium]
MKQEERTNTNAFSVSGVVESILFYDSTRDFTIIKIKTDKGHTVVLVGNMGKRNSGECLTAEGKWEMTEKWGYRLKVESFDVEQPKGNESLIKYLSSDLIKGIGKKYAKLLVDHFGNDVLNVVRETPERLLEVPGIGKKRAEAIKKALTAEDRDQRAIRKLSLKLLDKGIGPARIRKIYERYKGAALDILEKDTYRLADEIMGIGFILADKIANKMDVPKDSPSRIRAGLKYTLNKSSDEGHCFLPMKELIFRTGKMLNIDHRMISSQINKSIEVGELVLRGEKVYLSRLSEAEENSALILSGLLLTGLKAVPEKKINRSLDYIERNRKIVFTAEQRTAVFTALGPSSVSVITGGPGTGKTTVIDAIVSIAKEVSLRVALCAPTGRAANRLSHATGEPACTLHRLLEYTPGVGFKYGHSRPLHTDIIVLDEASMVDIELLSSLLFATRKGQRLVIVGDANQLPSVGPGQILADIISSSSVPTVSLRTIHRQADKSRIIAESYNVLNGRMPSLKNDPKGDFFFIPENDRESGLKLVVDLVARRLPEAYKLDPLRDIQVIVPSYKGICGVNALNAALRNEFISAANESDSRFFFGDKVMQTRNNYDLNVFNGDIGFVKSVTKNSITVDFGRDVTYDSASICDLTEAYAITAHKSQGGEVPCVVIPLFKEHFILLNRNLLYTAMTRAKQLCVIIGDVKALGIAVSKAKTHQRWTALGERIAEGVKIAGKS